MAIKKRKKRIKIRYEGVKFLTYCFFGLFLILFILINSIKIYNNYQYQKTDEYKIQTMGYSLDEAKDLIKILDDDIREFLLTNPKEDIYYNIINEKYFLKKNYLKYIDYQKTHQSLDLRTIVALVNTHASDGWYNSTYKTDLTKNNLISTSYFLLCHFIK